MRILNGNLKAIIQKFIALISLFFFAISFANGQKAPAIKKAENWYCSDIPKNDIPVLVRICVSQCCPSKKLNIGVDHGVGKDDYSITFRIGEAFRR